MVKTFRGMLAYTIQRRPTAGSGPSRLPLIKCIKGCNTEHNDTGQLPPIELPFGGLRIKALAPEGPRRTKVGPRNLHYFGWCAIEGR